jgi:hypothetical protein
VAYQKKSTQQRAFLTVFATSKQQINPSELSPLLARNRQERKPAHARLLRDDHNLQSAQRARS